MSIYVGGLRARLIHESIYQEILASLDALGWFDPGRQHSPVQFLSSGVPDFENVTLNTAALTSFDMIENEEELGSLFSEHRGLFYVDFFAENEAISLHFANDVKDIVAGRMPSIGRDNPSFSVYDYSQATPNVIFTVNIERVFIDRPSVYERPWQRYFRTVRFDVVDFYGQDNDV